MRKAVQRILNKYCQKRLEKTLPGINAEMAAYRRKSETTGTQFITLWLTVKGILREKPVHILESGTGLSTIVLAALVQKMRKDDPRYQGAIVSMESVDAWYDIAQSIFPDKYRDVVEIVLGPREKFEMGFFRGYCHSNIPERDYSFVLLDAPDFTDEFGVASCSDVFRIMEMSNAPQIHGVVDGRAGSVFVMQALFGTAAARYYHGLFAASFTVPNIDVYDKLLNTPKDYRCSPNGRLHLVKYR